MKPTVFLDRDGVLNQNIIGNNHPFAPQSLDDFVISADAADAVAAFRASGYLSIVVTNKPDVGSRQQRRKVVDQAHERLRAELKVDDIMVCYHTEADHCQCRKPKPGMLLAAARKYDIDLPCSWMIGDRWRDVEARHLAGCRTFFIDYAFAERRPQDPEVVVRSLTEAVPHVLRAELNNSERAYG